jgi:hypothetical protein
MGKSEVRRYEAPRAVRLSDAKTGALHCINGRSGNRDLCESGFEVQSQNTCANGLLVRP